MSLKVRVREPEIMDREDLDPALHREALRGLERLNVVAGSARLFLPAIEAAARSLAGTGRRLRVLDVACGAGDSLVRLARFARARGLDHEFHGCDVSPVAVRHGEEAARRASVAVSFHVANVLLEARPPVAADVVCNSLFLHHLERTDAVAFLARMREWTSSTLVAIDLLRTRLGYALAYAASRALTRSTVVRFDALASVRAAFTLEETRAIGIEAGLDGATVETVWPERFRLTWRRS